MWTIPDKGEGQNDLQSIVFQEYLDVLAEGLSGLTCVLSGCAVTGGSDMTPEVAAGYVLSNGVRYPIAANTVTIGTADGTHPRLDLVVVNSSGALAVRAGTAAAAPKPPARTANDVVLAVVYVPASDTTIATAQITDLRVMRSDLLVRRAPDFHFRPGLASTAYVDPSAADAAEGGNPSGTGKQLYPRQAIFSVTASSFVLLTAGLTGGFVSRAAGFHIEAIFSFDNDNNASGAAAFCGLIPVSRSFFGASETVASMISCLGVGFDAAEANLSLAHNDGSGPATMTDLGGSYPAANTPRFKLTLHCDPGGEPSYRFERTDTSAAPVEGVVSSNIFGTTEPLHFLFGANTVGGVGGYVYPELHDVRAWVGPL
jgi:hypothetical protein